MQKTMTVVLDDKLATGLEKQAQKEQRKLAPMLRILLDEALTRRSKHGL